MKATRGAVAWVSSAGKPFREKQLHGTKKLGKILEKMYSHGGPGCHSSEWLTGQ